MKKLVLPLVTLIIGFIAGYYFVQSKSTAPAPAGTIEFKSENSITREEAQLLVDTFGVHGLEDADHKPGGKGIKTRAVFLPLTKLDSLCAALDAERKADGKTDGIRVYFGRYPKLQPNGKTPYDHPFRNTIILVSTKDSTIISSRTKEKIRIHQDYFGAPNVKMPTMMIGTVPQNRGEMCPDNCDGAALLN